MSLFTNEHYGHIAGQLKITKEYYEEEGNDNAIMAVERVEDAFCHLFKNDNPNFDGNKFLFACALQSQKSDTSEDFMRQGK